MIFVTMPDLLTNRWHVGISVTRFGHLERIYTETSVRDMELHLYALKTDGFLLVFGSMGFLLFEVEIYKL